jgi:hypothetical protein
MIPPPLAEHIFSQYDHLRLDYLGPAHCTHAVIHAELDRLVTQSSGLVTQSEAGRSVEGRSISLVEFGHGPRRILLWTQMHGDETTATLAVLDVLNILTAERGEAWIGSLLEQVTVRCIVMLNPDGAERCQRLNAMQIDLNRDARALRTPEGMILREAHRSFQPEFAFNLHDQSLSSAGDSMNVSAIALLAPPADESRSVNDIRLRGMQMGAFVHHVLRPFAPGCLTRYPDDYEPRAFGDGMQSWGTSTLLIESGQWPGDPEKAFVRKLNAVALTSTIAAIGDGSYSQMPPDLYLDLPPNGKRLYDVLVRDVVVEHPSGLASKVEVGLNYVPRTMATRQQWPESVVVKEVGDLGLCGGLREIAGGGRRISSELVTVECSMPLAKLHAILGLAQGGR